MASKFSLARAGRSFCLLLAAVVITAGAFFASARRASADTVDWQAQDIVTANDGTSRVLFVADTDRGEVASLWKVDSKGNLLAATPVYGPYTDSQGDPYYPDGGFAIATNGNTYLLWEADTATGSTQGQVASVWQFDSNLHKLSSGPTYGPYDGWYTDQLLAAPDGSLRLKWHKTDASTDGTITGIWTLNAAGTAVSFGTTYGPYSDSYGQWRPLQMEVAPDKTTKLMWADLPKGGGTPYPKVSIWTLNSAGAVQHYGKTFGPFTGWKIRNFDISSNNNSIHLLWVNDSNSSGDISGPWTLDPMADNATYNTSTYGPYAGWFAFGIFANPNGAASIIWHQINNDQETTAFSVWTLGSGNQPINYGTTYGPYAGYTIYTFGGNDNRSQFNLLWTRSDDAFSVWSLNSQGNATAMGSANGPFTYP